MPDTHLHLSAHLNDGLRYLMPGLARSVRSGAHTVLVHLTDTGACAAVAGSPSPDSGTGPAVDRRGVRRALAQLATGDPESAWTDARLALPGLSAETSQLGNVRVVFLGLRPAEQEQSESALDALWRGESETVLTADGPIRRAELVGALASLVEQFSPTVVRLLDPDAEHVGFDDLGVWKRRDDRDHIASALLGLAALERLRERGFSGRYVVECHRARAAERWPVALGPEDVAERDGLLAVAAGEEGGAVRGGGLLRFGPSTQWLTLDGEGRLLAVAPVAGRLEARRRPASGSGPWEPVPFPALESEGCFAPTAEAITALDGRVYVFGQRLAVAEGDHAHGRGVLVSRQVGADGAFAPWVDLGGPSGNTSRDGMRRRLLGSPRGAIALADGGVQFFTRNAGNGISSRRIVFGRGWSHWLDFGGDGPDGAAAVTALDGTVDLAAPGDRSVRHWIQSGPLGTHTRDNGAATPATATALTLTDLGDGRVALLTRESPSAAVTGYLCPQGTPWGAAKPVRLGEVGGHGPVAAALSADGAWLALATRSSTGEAAYAWWDFTADAAPVWRTAGPVISGAPALAVDATGAMVLAVLGTDATVHAGELPAPDGQGQARLSGIG